MQIVEYGSCGSEVFVFASRSWRACMVFSSRTEVDGNLL